MKERLQTEKKKDSTGTQHGKWYKEGYAYGFIFAREEADYEELAAIVKAKEIPVNWDIFRAEILSGHMYNPLFDFQAYSEGFSKACIEFFEMI